MSQPPAIKDITHFVKECHKHKKEAWIAGSIKKDELPDLWATDVDVICVRGAACVQKDNGRFGEVQAKIVAELVKTMPLR
ncbi:hypothetical protein BMS3Abin06_02589 [bacterium BMS3Abin06]|nr:hypothetical protein BMS3Abin06_02589 [bacterium BMS3Abin06]HDZ01879.1 hypothetical protein [Nitrospirota bacterium]